MLRTQAGRLSAIISTTFGLEGADLAAKAGRAKLAHRKSRRFTDMAELQVYGADPALRHSGERAAAQKYSHSSEKLFRVSKRPFPGRISCRSSSQVWACGTKTALRPASSAGLISD